jgi:hypothetical protein
VYRDSRLPEAPREGSEQTRNQVRRNGGNHAEADFALLKIRRLGNRLASLGNSRKDRRGALIKRLAGGGEPHASGKPLEQSLAKFIFELADLLAQRRLRHVTGSRRPGEAADFHRRDEISKLLKFHRFPPDRVIL